LTTKQDIDNLWNSIALLREQIKQLKRYKGNVFYRQSYLKSRRVVFNSLAVLDAKISKSDNREAQRKFSAIRPTVKTIISDIPAEEQLALISKLELAWPELEVAVFAPSKGASEFEIPAEIPMVDYRLDLDEAIKTFENGFYLPALIMCRRAYETALVVLYKSKTGSEPVEDQKCPHCGKILRAKAYMGVVKLHKWAIAKGFVTERLESVGFLLSDLGAGAAHPPLTPFKRDPEIAKLGIVATIALLKEISGAVRGTSVKL
jgi:hypothetical protein